MADTDTIEPTFRPAETKTAAAPATPAPAPSPSIADAAAKAQEAKDDALRGKMRETTAKEMATFEQAGAEQSRLSQHYLGMLERERKMERADLASIKPWDTQKELSNRQTNLWEAFGSPAFLVAMLGSAFTARPMNSALAAGGAAIQALNRGKADEYEKAFEAFKENTDIAIKRLNEEHQEYNQILSEAHLSAQERTEKLRLALAKFGYQKALDAMDAGYYPQLNEMIGKQQEFATQLAENKFKLEQNNAMIGAVNELAKKPGYEGPAGRLKAIMEVTEQFKEAEYAGRGHRTGADAPLWDIATKVFPGSDPESLKKRADWVEDEKNKGRATPRSPQALILRRYMDDYKKAHGGEEPSPADLQRASAIYKETQAYAGATGTRAAGIEQFFKESGPIADKALAASRNMPRGDFVPWNEIKQKVAEKTSSPEMRVFHDWTQGLISVYAQVMNRGRGVSTVHAQERAEGLLPTTEGEAAYEAGVRTILAEIDIVKQAIHDTVSEIGADPAAAAPPSGVVKYEQGSDGTWHPVGGGGPATPPKGFPELPLSR